MEGRLRKELQEVRRDPNSGVSVEGDELSLTNFTGVLNGPSDTPYEGKKYFELFPSIFFILF